MYQIQQGSGSSSGENASGDEQLLYCRLPPSYDSEWKIIVNYLGSLVGGNRKMSNLDELIVFLKELDSVIVDQCKDPFNSVNGELEQSTNYHFRTLSFVYKRLKASKGDEKIMDEEKFVKKVLPKMAQWAMDVEKEIPDGKIPYLMMNQPGSVQLTRRQVRSVLSCAFFCLFRERGDESKKKVHVFEFGLFMSVASQTFLLALLNYFIRMYNLDKKGDKKHSLDEIIIFERKVLARNYSSTIEHEICQSDIKMCPLHFKDGKIQDNLNHLMVDFANCMIGGHVLGGAVAQEEIMFAECPELFVSILISPQMNVHETIKFTGFERYSNLKGYIKSMNYESYEDKQPVIENVKQNQIIAMDALQGVGQSQFQKEYVLREIYKTCCAFSNKNSDLLSPLDNQLPSPENEPVATGFWGCGMFGGDKQLKVIIQWLSATLCNRPSITIHVFSPDDVKIQEEFNKKVLPIIEEKEITLGQIANCLLNTYPNSRKEGCPVFDFLNNSFK